MAHVASQPSKKSKGTTSHPRRWPRWPFVWALVLLLAALWLLADWWHGLPDDAEAAFVGRQSCIECHQPQGHKFQGSHHDLAMDLATPETVLGDFSDQTLEHHGVTSRMYRRDGKFYIETEGPEGKPGEFEIKYVFGVTPLQQYMVEFDRPADMPANEVARLQVLRVSWNTLKKHWFHLDPPDVQEKLDPSDDLHWTGIAQRWNAMCADCHSTNLQKNFDVESGVYHTTFSEIDVSCEACHGPGSLHVELAKQASPFWDRNRGYALARLKGEPAIAEIESCAPCHARRSTIHSGFTAGCNFQDYYASETLSEATYHADGQILDEVYEYGSFLQSKMYHKQVRCSDCHDPHSARLKHSGNAACTSCHQHPAAKYDTVAHHNHKPGTEGAQCVSCHMPATTYMDVDSRRDHSFRIPRPDLSVELGTPNACTGCHLRDTQLPPEVRPTSPTPNRPAEYADWLREARSGNRDIQAELSKIDGWADGWIKKWFPRAKRKPHFAAALSAARKQSPDAQQGLIKLLKDRTQPAVARATAATELGAYVHPEMQADEPTIAALVKALTDRDPQVRAAAIGSLQAADLNLLREALPPLLKDPLRLVRTRAAFALSSFPSDQVLRRDEPVWFKKALEELLTGAEFDNDRAGGHLLRGTVLENQGRTSEALDEYETALRLEPFSAAPKSSLAGLLNDLASQEQAALQQAASFGDAAGAQRHAQGAGQLAARFEQLKTEEWSFLERDAEMVPDNPALQLQVGLARHHQGYEKEAAYSLAAAHWLAPRNPLFGYYLAIYYRDAGRLDEARQLAERLVALRSKQPEYERLLSELKELEAAGNR